MLNIQGGVHVVGGALKRRLLVLQSCPQHGTTPGHSVARRRCRCYNSDDGATMVEGNATMVDGSATIVDINAAMVDGHECYKPKSRLLSLSCQGARASRPVLLRDSR
jgi:hypothetical protein